MEILLVLMMIGLLTYGILMWSAVFYFFWAWFIMPVFPNIPELTFGMAMGLHMFSLLLQKKSSARIKDKYKDSSIDWEGVSLPLITLGLGWLIMMIIN